MNFSDNFFKRVEKKTNVSKDTILSLASKLQENDLKNEGVLRDIIRELGTLTGKNISPEKEYKIAASIGSAGGVINNTIDVQSLMDIADEKMYADKNERKQARK